MNIKVIESALQGINDLCRQYGVDRLELFGSAVTTDFDPAHSDLDFIVDFAPRTESLFKRYFGLKRDLEILCGRPVDLVMQGAMNDPYFIQSANQTRRVVYAQQDTETA